MTNQSLLMTNDYLLLTTSYCLLPTAYLLPAYYLLLTSHHLFLITRYSLFTTQPATTQLAKADGRTLKIDFPETYSVSVSASLYMLVGSSDGPCSQSHLLPFDQ